MACGVILSVKVKGQDIRTKIMEIVERSADTLLHSCISFCIKCAKVKGMIKLSDIGRLYAESCIYVFHVSSGYSVLGFQNFWKITWCDPRFNSEPFCAVHQLSLHRGPHNNAKNPHLSSLT